MHYKSSCNAPYNDLKNNDNHSYNTNLFNVTPVENARDKLSFKYYNAF